jgi:hypothetical protein
MRGQSVTRESVMLDFGDLEAFLDWLKSNHKSVEMTDYAIDIYDGEVLSSDRLRALLIEFNARNDKPTG